MMTFSYPEDLPVSAFRAEILAAVRAHPVVIVSGDTGSGKTTQLPKMMLELGRAARGRRIAVTQPRRLAAVTMAERVAEELGEPKLVGYRHRYAKAITSETRIEFLTDGILLNETKFDPLLNAYDTIIVDEAHERSLNVDFLLGILRRILEKRRDLKVLIASATMDTLRFAEFFDAPVIEVPGRLFPIEIRYRAPEEEDDPDLGEAVARAIRELPSAGDILVFLSGERDIRETGEHLEHVFGGRDEIIPLLASLPAGEQKRAFTLSTRRRIVLATNVAETSVTIPGIRYVIDSGLARLKRYIHRTHVQRLQIEPVSQASARQRAGRCGRLGPGICIRLYSEADFLKRDAFTPPEVLRSSLAGVILQMLDLKLGAIELFPFIDPPKPAMIREGLKELLELQAIAHGERSIELTAIGKKLARLPLEPRLARMLIAANERGVLAEVLPIVAAMSCDDPRRRPIDEKEKAAQAHAKWRVAESDFLSTLKLWDWWREETKDLSQTKARKLAKANYLAWAKMREWADLKRQLESLSSRLELTNAASNRSRDDLYAAIHISLLTGLLGRIGHYHPDDHAYRGAHALNFAIHPGSALAKRRTRHAARSTPPEWLVAGELVDTARLFAREAALIDPKWIEPIARDLVKHHVHSPMWEASSGFVRATEQVTLYGLVIVEARRCDYARFNPEGAREIFLRNGLLTGEIARPTPLLKETFAFLRALRERAEKTREPEIFDELKLLAHFDAALPKEITNANALKKFLSAASREEIERFKLKRKDWWPNEAASRRDFPDVIEVGGEKLRLTYRNTPDDPTRDGITCTFRESQLAAARFWRADWLVPGLLRKKVSYLLLSLPNSFQRLLKPLDDSITIILDALKADAPLTKAIRTAVFERWGFKIPAELFAEAKLPAYLTVRFVMTDEKDGRVLHDARELPKREAPKAPPKAREMTYEERAILKETEKTVRKLDLLLSTGAYPETTSEAVNEQLAFLTFTDFATRVPIDYLRRYARYLKAIEIRLERAKLSPSSDRAKEARFAPYWQTYREAARQVGKIDGEVLTRYRWLLEELRIQTFAPELKTFEKVSPKILEELCASLYLEE